MENGNADNDKEREGREGKKQWEIKRDREREQYADGEIWDRLFRRLKDERIDYETGKSTYRKLLILNMNVYIFNGVCHAFFCLLHL